MQISDFIQKYLATNHPALVISASELIQHIDAYLRQIWPEGKIAVISESEYREDTEHTILPALKNAGVETAYCLCVKSAGIPYRTQIEESFGNEEHTTGILAVGSRDLFAAAREYAGLHKIRCCAMPDDFCPINAFEPYGENPCVDALFFDLDKIADKYKGRFQDARANLEQTIAATRLDALTLKALNLPVPAAVFQAINEAHLPEIPQNSFLSEDELAELTEAYVWYALAMRLIGKKSSLQAVSEYAAESPEFQEYTVSQHIRILSQILDYALEIESLEIDPDECAAHQPPREILNRTLQQILLEDSMKLDRLKTLDYEDRIRLKHTLYAAAENWDDFCASSRSIAEMLHIFSQTDNDDEPEIDAALKTLWIHAGHFAPIGSFLRLMNDMRQIEPALYH